MLPESYEIALKEDSIDYFALPCSPGKAQQGKDVVVFISHSGNTQECVIAAQHLVAKGVTVLGLTGRKGNASLYVRCRF